MSLELMSLILIGSLLILLFMGVEIAVGIGIVASLGLLFFVGQPLQQFSFTAWETMNSFTLTSVPLFIFMGAVLANTGIIRVLFTAADKLIGFLPGGIASSVIGANAVFGAMSGSTIAAAATFGQIAFPEMERLNYNPRLALGSIAVGGTLSTLIPPSVMLIIYGGLVLVPVPRLFAAGIIPGIILTLLLILTVVVQVKLNPSLTPTKPPKYNWKERLTAAKDLIPFLALVILTLGAIFAGIMTPTEAASLGAFLSIVLALGYRKMSFSALKESMWTAVKITSMIAFLMVTARVLGMVFQYIGLTQAFSDGMLGLALGRYVTFAIVCVMYLILGMFFDGISMMVLTFPFVVPLVEGLGFSLLWFGIVFVILIEIAVVTPPFGLNLFALHGVVPQHDIMTIALGSLPFLVPTLLLIVLLTAFPKIVLWLPGILY